MSDIEVDQSRSAKLSRPIDSMVDANGCHVCVSHCDNGQGYPVLNRSGARWRMSRYVFEQVYGPVPIGMRVCHLCDEPRCINPEHLFLGTDADNLHDRDRKGRGASGSRNGQAKLTERQAIEIFQSDGVGRELARLYGVTEGVISQIRLGRRWVRATGGKA